MNSIGFVFSGQGSQYSGMCKKIYKEEPVVKKCFDEISEISGLDMADICFGEKTELLKSTAYAQLAIFTASVSQLLLFREKCGVKPDFVAGNSIGEYAALYCAGVFSLETAVSLVKFRAEYMDAEAQANYGVMYDIKGIDTDEVEKIVESLSTEGVICISNYNGKNNVVISGEEKAVNKAVERINADGGRVIKLNVSSGFHSLLMKKATEKFEEIVKMYSFSEPDTQVISNITGLPYKNSAQIKETLPHQIINSVKWYQSVQFMETNGCVEAIEFGPKKVLKNLIERNSNITVYSYDLENDRIYAEMLFNKIKINLLIFGEFLKEAVIRENYNTDLSGYNDFVIKPYREIEKIYLKMKNDNYCINDNDAENCKEWLLKILQFKKTESAEMICERIYENVKTKLIGAM